MLSRKSIGVTLANVFMYEDRLAVVFSRATSPAPTFDSESRLLDDIG